MKTVRIVLSALCALLILGIPFLVPSPNMVYEVKERMSDMLSREEGMELDEEEETDEEDEDDGIDVFSLLFSTARAEDDDLIVEVLEGDAADSPFPVEPVWELPFDFTVPPEPNPACYTETGYADETIIAEVEDIQGDKVLWHVARIRIASPTQLRTAVYDSSRLSSTRTALVSQMAKKNHAVIALNGDNYQDDTSKTTFEYRMTEKIRSKTNKKKDILIIDENGDFHLVLAAPKDEQAAALKAVAEEHQIINAYTFGPALVRDGEKLTVDPEYGYHPGGLEPRAAIGQTGKLSYIFVIAEGRRSNSDGVTQQQLADFMFEQGCVQAFNLDGGNSACMVIGDKTYVGQSGDRGINDIIYFATAVPEENWK